MSVAIPKPLPANSIVKHTMRFVTVTTVTWEVPMGDLTQHFNALDSMGFDAPVPTPTTPAQLSVIERAINDSRVETVNGIAGNVTSSSLIRGDISGTTGIAAIARTHTPISPRLVGVRKPPGAPRKNRINRRRQIPEDLRRKLF